jgi:hypothetical protein
MPKEKEEKGNRWASWKPKEKEKEIDDRKDKVVNCKFMEETRIGSSPILGSRRGKQKEEGGGEEGR